MRSYSWPYGIFHWIVHYSLTILLVSLSGIVIFPIYTSYTVFGVEMNINIVDYSLALVLTFLIDLDHITVFKKFGLKKIIFAQKRFIAPIHNFFFLSVFSIGAAFITLFVSRDVGVLFFVVVLHMLWDIFEDVFVFRTSFRRWEKTWGINTKDIEDAYNELLQVEPLQEKKESIIRKNVTRLKEKIKRKKPATV